MKFRTKRDLKTLKKKVLKRKKENEEFEKMVNKLNIKFIKKLNEAIATLG